MKKLLLLIPVIFLLTGCDSSFKCVKGDDVIKIRYNSDELVTVTKNGEDVGNFEFAVYETTYSLVGVEGFEEAVIEFNEVLGYECK